MPWVYIVQCLDDSFSVGSTRVLEVRIDEHVRGIGADYTKRHGFKRLAWAEEVDNVGEAYALENKIQGWSHAKRQALIDGDFERLRTLSRNAKNRSRSTQ